MKIRFGWVALVAALMLFLGACGGGSDDEASSDADDEPTTAPESAADDASASDDSGDDAADPADDGDAGDTADSGDGASDEGSGGDGAASSGTFEPGAIEFRAINLLAEPVDVYVRTTGLVEAFPIVEGLVPGEMTEYVAPPEGGNFLVTTAGAGDPTCVASCDHFITRLSAFPEDGPSHLVVLYEDEFSGPSAYDIWEQAPSDRIGTTTNALPQAQSSTSMAIVLAVAATDIDFGLRTSTDVADGCLDSLNLDGNILVGGNQTPAFAFDGASTVSFYDNQDQECAGEVVGGPFDFTGAPGTRILMVLTGPRDALEAIQIELPTGEVIDTPAGDTGDAGGAGGADLDTAVDLLVVDALETFPLTEDEATCLAGLIVDRIDPSTLVVDGVLVDLDTMSPEINALAGEAIVESVTACAIDPSVLGG